MGVPIIESLLPFISIELFLTFFGIFLALRILKSDKVDKNLYDRTIDLSNNIYPAFFPNGWLPILDSFGLKSGQVVPIYAFGHDLVAFRTTSGNVSVFDAYCPHLGANLGYGGVVDNNSIKCPFHGWTFNQNGRCIDIPGLENSNVPKVQIKAWDSIEVNGYIFIWNHSEGKEPHWFPHNDKHFLDGQVIYQGRFEQTINCHIQEISENLADFMHLDPIHGPAEFMGTQVNKRPFYDTVLKYLRCEWTGNWRVFEAPDEHLAESKFHGKFKLFGFTIWSTSSTMKLVGPANMWIDVHIESLINIDIHLSQAVISVGPLKQRSIGQLYSNANWFISKLALHSYSLNTQRDAVIFNNKKYLTKPNLTKNEQPIKSFRRWFNQFYPAT